MKKPYLDAPPSKIVEELENGSIPAGPFDVHLLDVRRRDPGGLSGLRQPSQNDVAIELTTRKQLGDYGTHACSRVARELS